MENNNLDWDELGRNIQDIIDRAVNSSDFRKLDQTIRQVVDRTVDQGSEVVRKVVDSSASRQTKPQTAEKKNLPVLYGSTGSTTTKGVLKTVGGGVLSLFSLSILFSSLAVEVVFGGGLLSIPGILSLVGIGGGAWLICGGVDALGMAKRFRTYRRILGQKTHCSLEKLAHGVGKSVKFVRRELRQMIGQGLFLEGHLDKEGTCLITSDETYQYFEQSRLQLEERQRQEAARAEKIGAHSPQVQEVLDRGNAFIAQIRKSNDAIPGEEISAKIDHMENIVRRIFERAEQHPQIVPDLKKMMDYYLPMTVKLLNAYADMDAQPIQGETIQNSKREIEATLDTLNLAFEKLLDSVFADTALDISSDISVLNTLLAQEGLAEDDLTKMKKQQTMK